MTVDSGDRDECLDCHRPLTNELSRFLKRGPKCRRGLPTLPSIPVPRVSRPAGPVEVDPGQLAIPIQLTLT